MMNVVATNHIYRSRTKKQETTLEHPLARRMTALQLSVMELLEATKANLGDTFTAMMADRRIHIYYSTSIGEINSVTTIAKAVHAKTLPCSPAAFQHSVHNAAAGYIASTYKTRNPSLTFSSGFLSFDLTMLLAARKIAAGFIDGAFIVHGEEKKTSSDDAESEAEVLVLLRDDSQYLAKSNAGVSWQLKDIRHFTSIDSLQSFQSDVPSVEGTKFSEKAENSGLSPLFPLDFQSDATAHVRLAKTLNGESVVSIWRRA